MSTTSTSSDLARRPSSAPTQGGFSLMEVMVAIAILSLALFPLLLIRNESIRDASFTQRLLTARDLGMRKLDEILMAPERFREGSSGDFFEYQEEDRALYEGFTWELQLFSPLRQTGAEDPYANDSAGGGFLGDSQAPTREPPADAMQPRTVGDTDTPITLMQVGLLVYYPGARGEEDPRQLRLDTIVSLPIEMEDR